MVMNIYYKLLIADVVVKKHLTTRQSYSLNTNVVLVGMQRWRDRQTDGAIILYMLPFGGIKLYSGNKV
jgi:hypothetical protein